MSKECGSADHGYNQPGALVQACDVEGGTLPFTGFDLALPVVAAVALAAIGYTLKRMTRLPAA